MAKNPSTTLPNRRILDKHFVEQAISQPIKDYQISPGSKAGDNIAGHLLSVDVQTQSDEIHNLIFKSLLPLTGTLDHAVLQNTERIIATKIFWTEIIYYRDIVPMFQKVIDKQGLSICSPKFYFGFHDEENEMNDYLVLEDLRPSGYKMLDKFNGLGLQEMEVVLKKFAQFHAISYALLNENGSLADTELVKMKNDTNCVLNRHGIDFRVGDPSILFDEQIQGIAKLAKEDLGFSSDKMIEKYGTGFWPKMLQLWKRTGNSDKFFPVLVHGDLWTNNILFKKGKNGIEDVKFIDFQMIRFGNIYEDLHYLIFASTPAKFRRANLPHCLKTYFLEFSKTLKTLECPMPKGFTEGELLSTFNETFECGAVYTFITIPYQLGIEKETKKEVVEEKKGHGGDKASVINRILREGVASRVEATRNSPIAMEWLKDSIEEMIEHDII